MKRIKKGFIAVFTVAIIGMFTAIIFRRKSRKQRENLA